VHELGVTLSLITRACIYVFYFPKYESRPPSRYPLLQVSVCHFAPKCQCTFAARASPYENPRREPRCPIYLSHGLMASVYYHSSTFLPSARHPILGEESFSSEGEKHSSWRGLRFSRKRKLSNPHVIGLFLFLTASKGTQPCPVLFKQRTVQLTRLMMVCWDIGTL